MTIGIEAERANNPQKTGVEHYAKQLILHLAKIDRQNRYVLYLRTPPEKWFLELPNNFKIKVIPFPKFWTQIRLSIEMIMHPVDVLLIPASALPLIHPKKSVVTIHDIAREFFPQGFTWFMRNYLRWSTGHAVKRASRLIAVSEYTKKDLLNHYSISPDKVKVVYMGYEPVDISNITPSAEISDKLPEKYVLFLSTLQPRKNLPGLITAFAELKRENNNIPHKLVVVGRRGWKYDESLQAINNNSDNVIYLDHVSDSDRWAVMKKASALVLPSFYEGFGMQLLEAMHVGVPMAVSNVSSLPEVAGDAAVYFDPNDIAEIKKAILRILTDETLAADLARRGRERIKGFSWEKCAGETLDVLAS